MKTHPIRAALLAALASAALAACAGDDPVAPNARKAPSLSCPASRIHADCGPVINPPGDTTGTGGGTTTPPPPAASFVYGVVHNVYAGIKSVEMGAVSQSYSNVAYTRVDVLVNRRACGGGLVLQAYSDYAEGYGSPFRAARGITYTYPTQTTYYSWSIDSKHQFTPATGATGGGTFYATWTGCV